MKLRGETTDLAGTLVVGIQLTKVYRPPTISREGPMGPMVPDGTGEPEGPEQCYGAKTVVDAHNACAGDPYFPFVLDATVSWAPFGAGGHVTTACISGHGDPSTLHFFSSKWLRKSWSFHPNSVSLNGFCLIHGQGWDWYPFFGILSWSWSWSSFRGQDSSPAAEDFYGKEGHQVGPLFQVGQHWGYDGTIS